MRVASKLHWLHVACTDLLTYYAVDAQRGRPAQERIGILPVFKGNAVHDALASYLVWTCDHGLCNAHLLRELIGLEESIRQRWPTRLKVLLLDMQAAVDTAVQHNQSALQPAVLADFEADYDRLVRRAIRANPRPIYQIGQRGRPRASPARNLAERLRDHKHSVLRFLHDFRVPFDNNLAERDLRMRNVLARGMKVKQKSLAAFAVWTALPCSPPCAATSPPRASRAMARSMLCVLYSMALPLRYNWPE